MSERPALTNAHTHVNTWEVGQWPGRARLPVRALVQHVMAGTLAGSISHARRAGSEASFNYGIAKDGRIAEVVDPDLQAPYANGIVNARDTMLPAHLADLRGGYPNANWVTISVEHEGFPLDDDFMNPVQLAASARLNAWLATKYGLTVTRDTILGHYQFSSAQRANCPGPRFPYERLIAGIQTLMTPERLYFPETGKHLYGGFRAYWERHGGVPVFGYPVSEEMSEDGRTVQYFERARFEWHPEQQGTPHEVQLTRLGAVAARAAGLSGPGIPTEEDLA